LATGVSSTAHLGIFSSGMGSFAALCTVGIQIRLAAAESRFVWPQRHRGFPEPRPGKCFPLASMWRPPALPQFRVLILAISHWIFASLSQVASFSTLFHNEFSFIPKFGRWPGRWRHHERRRRASTISNNLPSKSLVGKPHAEAKITITIFGLEHYLRISKRGFWIARH